MTRRLLPQAVLSLLLSISGGITAAAVTPVGDQEAQNWIRWAIPMPHQIKITGKVVLPVSQVAITVTQNAGDVEKTAQTDLLSLLGGKLATQTDQAGFTIVLGTIDAAGKLADVDLKADADRLKALPNPDQAYIIKPVGETRLILAAINEKGAYYAAMTLRQLLEPKIKTKQVEIPIAVITDWPDIPRRGMWEDPLKANELIELSHYKWNSFDAHIQLSMTQDGHGKAIAAPGRIPAIEGLSYNEFCRRHAILFAPVITHIGHLKKTGIYDKHSDLIGKGDHVYSKRFPRLVAPCVSNPKFKQIMIEWMTDLAACPGVEELYAWLTEEEVYCSCDQCLAAGQFVQETRVLVDAYRQVQKKYPNLKFRICLTQGSYPVNDKVLKEIPHDIGAIYYDGGRSYISNREPLIYPVLEKYKKDGGMLGVVPQMTTSWSQVIPWSCPQYVRYRMNEFFDKGLYLVCNYITPIYHLYPFNTQAAAEWMWNAKGRSEKDFSTAWATRQGIANPDAVADWADSLGQVSWDVYGSSFPYKLAWIDILTVMKSKMKPVLGKDIYLYYPTPEKFDANLAICEKAITLAKNTGDPSILDETLITQGYQKMLRELYYIQNLAADLKPDDASKKSEIQNHLVALTEAGLAINAAMNTWGQRMKTTGHGRFTGVLNLNAKILNYTTDAMASMGVVNPLKEKLPKVVEKSDK